MKLHYKKFGAGEPLLVLHGLMGMLDNWQTPAKTFAEHFEVYLIDQRNHGHSPHDPEQSYEAMMEDLLELMEDLGLPEAHLLGHSMGGKTVMKFAQNHPDMVRKLIVADIAPKAYPVHHQRILAGLRAVNLDAITRRGEADAALQQHIDEPGIRHFLMKNLYWVERGKLGWRINLDAIEANIAQMGDAVLDQMYSEEVLFIRGAKSDYILDSDWDDVQTVFPEASLETIEDAGHWVHAEQPQAFLDVAMKYLLED